MRNALAEPSHLKHINLKKHEKFEGRAKTTLAKTALNRTLES